MNKDEEVKQAIKAAAKRVFAKWGLNKTTMEDIAGEAGKGKSTLYYYFKSKEEIFETVAIDELNRISLKACTAIEAIDSPKDKMKAYITATITEMKQIIGIYSFIKGEIKGNKTLIDNIRKQYDQCEERILREMLRQGLKLNEFNSLKETELDKAANVLVGMIRGLQLYLFLENEDSEKIDIATRLLVDGL
jgi:AcrR family transcriptional regulator